MDLELSEQERVSLHIKSIKIFCTYIVKCIIKEHIDSIREPYFMNSTTNGKYSTDYQILRSPT